ncbi:MAG: phosphoribosyltransferase [Candidatus Harrisonbacteria bacterium]|nr:phosphoribosyltransferase [Candidatus Harrisonbacteria bacterium]
METFEKISEEGKEKPINTQEKDLQYHFGGIMEELEYPTSRLIEQLKETIDAGEYDMLIGDDASGRIPTLVMKDIISSRMRVLHPDLTSEEDRNLLKTRFIASGRHNANKEQLIAFFRKIKSEIKKKALIVTEFMATGASMEQLAEILEQEHIPFDIASIASHSSKRSYQGGGYFLPSILGRRGLFIGSENASVPFLYNDSDLSGVQKKSRGQHLSAHAERPDSVNQERTGQIREDAHVLADRVLKEVWKNK